MSELSIVLVVIAVFGLIGWLGSVVGWKQWCDIKQRIRQLLY